MAYDPEKLQRKEDSSGTPLRQVKRKPELNVNLDGNGSPNSLLGVLIESGLAVPALLMRENETGGSSWDELEKRGFTIEAISGDGEHFEVRPPQGWTVSLEDDQYVYYDATGQVQFKFGNFWDHGPLGTHNIQLPLSESR